MEQLYQDELGAHAAVLAHHFAAAEPVLGPEQPVRYSLLAGQQALAAHAYEDALAHFQRGLAAKRGLASSEASPSARRSEGFELIQDAETAELMVGLGIAQAATLGRHQFEGAVDNLRLAFNFYVGSGDVSSAVTIAQYPFPYWARRLREWSRLLRMLSPSFPQTPPSGRSSPVVLRASAGRKDGKLRKRATGL
jgi:hypothetical protein